MKHKTALAAAALALWGLMAGPARGNILDTLKAKYDAAIKSSARRHGLDPVLVHAVIRAESGYNRWAVSSAGAQGLMQLMPETAAFYGVADPFDAETNIEGGVKYLKALAALYDGRTDLILAAYNAGQSAVQRYNGVPPYPETRAYIESVKTVFSHETIRVRARIYSFVDESGRRVVTNDARLAPGLAR